MLQIALGKKEYSHYPVVFFNDEPTITYLSGPMAFMPITIESKLGAIS
jgi:hypothetical protein